MLRLCTVVPRQPKWPLSKLFWDFPLGLVLKLVVSALDKNCLKVSVGAIIAMVKLPPPGFSMDKSGDSVGFVFIFFPVFLPCLSFFSAYSSPALQMCLISFSLFFLCSLLIVNEAVIVLFIALFFWNFRI